MTPKGLEPPTNRTGICHSIQLNYGAKWAAKIGKKRIAIPPYYSGLLKFRPDGFNFLRQGGFQLIGFLMGRRDLIVQLLPRIN